MRTADGHRRLKTFVADCKCVKTFVQYEKASGRARKVRQKTETILLASGYYRQRLERTLLRAL